MKHSGLKRTLALMLAVVMSFTVLGATALAASVKNYSGKYGKMMPTTAKFSGVSKSYSFTGDSGTLYFYFASKGYSKNVYYGFEIYSDSAMTEKVVATSGEFPTVNSETEIKWSLTNVKSGIYYGKSYTAVKTKSGMITDSASVYKFTITVNRVGAVTPAFSSIGSSVNGVILKWNEVSFADTYYLYRKIQGADSWTCIAKIGNNGDAQYTYTDSTAIAGFYYTYTLKASDGSCKSKYNKNGFGFTYLGAPEFNGEAETLADNFISFSWSAVPGSDGYRVYRKTDDSAVVRLGTLKGGDNTEFTDKTAKTDSETYYYLVRAYRNSDLGIVSKYLPVTLNGMKYFSEVSCKDGLVKLKWDAVENASGYRVYRRVTDGEWEMILDSASAQEFTDTHTAEGETYYYSLTAYFEDGSQSSMDTTGTPATCLASPEAPSVSNNEKNSVLIKYQAVEGASSYNIYRRTADTEYEFLGSTALLYFYDTAEKANNLRYTYCVSALAQNSEGAASVGSSVIFMEAPEISPVKAVSGGNLISWETVPGATAYRVFRCVPGGTSTAVGTVKGVTSFTDKTASAGKAYYYRVSAMNGTVNGSYSAWEGINCLNAPEVLTTAERQDSAITVTWKAISGASGYYVYRKTPDGSWTKLSAVKGTSYADTAKKQSGEKYIYTVKAYNSKGAGIADKFGKGITWLSNPVVETESVKADGVTISWEQVTGAESYTVYRKTDGKWKLIAQEDGNTFYDSSVENGNVYYYTVRAVSGDDRSGYDGTGAKAAFYINPVITSMKTNFAGALTLKWEKAEDAIQYAVFRKTESTEWELISKCSECTYTDSSERISGETYSYYISYYNGKDYCIIPENGDSYTYLGIPVFTGEVCPDGSVNVSWDAVDGAESYIVYRRAEDEGTWSVIASGVTETLCNDSSTAPATRYRYTVKACCTGSFSGYDAAAEYVLSLSDVTGLTAEYDGNSNAVLTWNAVDGANSYRVYRKGESGDILLIDGNVTELTYSDDTGDIAIENTYYVVASCDAGSAQIPETGFVLAPLWIG